jgi:hypothetical protein
MRRKRKEKKTTRKNVGTEMKKWEVWKNEGKSEK